jgi:hypothetical protein
MPAVGHRNAGGAATIAEPFASRRDWRPARNLLADPNLHVVDQKPQPTGIACLLKRGGNRQPMDRLHRQPLRRQVATRQQSQYSIPMWTLRWTREASSGSGIWSDAFACPASLCGCSLPWPLGITKPLRDRRFGQGTTRSTAVRTSAAGAARIGSFPYFWAHCESLKPCLAEMVVSSALMNVEGEAQLKDAFGEDDSRSAA